MTDDSLTPAGSLPRRRFLMLGGAAILTSAVLAACGSDDDGSSGAATGESTTTTAPIAASDLTTLRASSSLEEAVIAVYTSAIATELVTTESVQTTLNAFLTHHKDHSQLIRNATQEAGGDPYTKPNPAVMTTANPRVQALRTERDVVQLAYDMERMLTASYQSFVGTFKDIQFNQKAMMVGGTESRHAAFLAPFLGKSASPDGAFHSTTGAVGTSGI